MRHLDSLLVLVPLSIALPACDRVDPRGSAASADPAATEQIKIVTPQELDTLPIEGAR